MTRTVSDAQWHTSPSQYTFFVTCRPSDREDVRISVRFSVCILISIRITLCPYNVKGILYKEKECVCLCMCECVRVSMRVLQL